MSISGFCLTMAMCGSRKYFALMGPTLSEMLGYCLCGVRSVEKSNKCIDIIHNRDPVSPFAPLVGPRPHMENHCQVEYIYKSYIYIHIDRWEETMPSQPIRFFGSHCLSCDVAASLSCRDAVTVMATQMLYFDFPFL